MNIFSNLLFTPIDFEVPTINFESINFTHFKPNHSPFWDYEQLLDNPHTYQGNNVWRTDLDESRLKLKELVLKLPLTELYNVRLSIQTNKVTPHIDITLKDMPREYLHEYINTEPCGYRFVFQGANDSLKVIKNKTSHTAYLPNVPGLYLLNSTSGVHYLDDDIGRITLYVRGKVNVEEHIKLIEKSLRKFKQHAIFQF